MRSDAARRDRDRPSRRTRCDLVVSRGVDWRECPVLTGGRMGSPSGLAPPADPATRLLLGGTLVILSGLAWAWTVAMAAMPECHVVGLAPFVVMWTVMMAAMMFPSMIPVVLAFAGF